MNTPVLPAFVTRARRNGLGELLWRSARRVPDKLALAYGERRWTYAALDEAVNRVANALLARGVSKGERIALLSHNNDAFVLIHFAAARIGAILVPINFMLKGSEVAYILEHSAAVALVAEDRMVSVAEEALAMAPPTVRLKGMIPDHGEPTPPGWESVADWQRHPDTSQPDIETGEDEPLQLLYTSGTESRPKGATLSARNYVSQYVSCIVDGEMSGDDIEVHALPLFHCAQLHCFLTPGLYLGATNILLPGADPATMLAMIETHRATKLFCPPTVWIGLLRHPDFDRRDLSSLRKGYYGASIMPMEVVKELSERLPQMRLFNFYGQTEMSPLATALKPEDQIRKLGSAGKACINVETRIVDDDDRPVPPGTVGEIVHRGPHVMLGYWNDPAKTAELKSAELTATDVNIVSTHATSTPQGDVQECRAVHLPSFTDRQVHPTINVDDLDPDCALNNLVIGKPVELKKVDVILNNSFGMLGINSCVVVKRYAG